MTPNNINQNSRNHLDGGSLFKISCVAAAGLLAILVYGFQAQSPSSMASTAAVGVLTAGTSFLVGSLIGLLFGIPRRLQGEPIESPTASLGSDNSRRSLYGANTNLEQISDWLTKILVGVGLTQMGELASLLKKVATFAGDGIDGRGAVVFASFIIIGFSVNGFLFGYLWTRLYLGRALDDAERAHLERRINKLEQQSYADAQALHLAARQLSVEEMEPATNDLHAAVKAATPETRAAIFYRAYTQRWRNNAREATKNVMARTIPIFQALAASDTEEKYHNNHGQLGFALKDQNNPNWEAAENALSTAIRLRTASNTQGYQLYEFNRALCRIMQDACFNQNRPSTSTAQESIMADIIFAIEDEWMRGVAQKDARILKWLKLNNLQLPDNIKASEGHG